jgi:uncharacterized membrane protein
VRKSYKVKAFLSRDLDGWVLGAALLVGVMLTTLSILRYTGYTAGMFDLGNMTQAIWNGTQGRPLTFTYTFGNMSRLALHVEFIYCLIVPPYALWSDPWLLLLIQAVLFVAGALPVYRIARRHLTSRWMARVVVWTYLFFPTALNAVLFDFHGDTLALPLLLFALDAQEREDRRAYWVWLLLALSCKFYVAVPVGALGVVLWLKGKRSLGAATALIAVAWFALTFFVVRSWFASPEADRVFSTSEGYIGFYFGQILRDLRSSWVPRLLTAVIVFLPGLWLGWRAPLWWLPTCAVGLPVLLSSGPGPSYSYRYHHYALTVPFTLYAMIRGAAVLRRKQGETPVGRRSGRLWQGEVWLTLGITLMFTVALVDMPLNPRFWLAPPAVGLDPWAYGQTPRDRVKDRWLADKVPDREPLASSLFLAPHVANRETLFLTRYPKELRELRQPDHLYQTVYLMRQPGELGALHLSQNLAEVDYVVADALFDYTVPLEGGLTFGGTLYDVPAIMLLLHDPDFDLVAARDGLLLFARNADVAPLSQEVTRLSSTDTYEALATFGEIALLDVTVESLGNNRFLLRCDWTRSGTTDMPPLFAVSRLEEVEGARIVHLPTLALHPTVNWVPDEVVREEFTFVLPDDVIPGRYTLWVGWYDGRDPYAAFTDARSRLGDEVQIAEIVVK